jgi:hypothetical protein
MKQYIIVNGVHKVNLTFRPAAPVHFRFSFKNTAASVPFPNKNTALAVISAPPSSYNNDEDEIVVTPMYQQAVATSMPK